MPNDEKLKDLSKIYKISFDKLVQLRTYVESTIDPYYQPRAFARLLYKEKSLRNKPNR